MWVGDGGGLKVSVGDGDGVGGTGDGVRLGKGGKVIDAEVDGSTVWGVSTGVTVVSTPWQAAIRIRLMISRVDFNTRLMHTSHWKCILYQLTPGEEAALDFPVDILAIVPVPHPLGKPSCEIICIPNGYYSNIYFSAHLAVLKIDCQATEVAATKIPKSTYVDFNKPFSVCCGLEGLLNTASNGFMV